jgi:DHA3 family tetracycline resistance protein-like MFS transporter
MCDSLMKKLSSERIYYLRCAVWGFNSGLIFTSIWVLYYSVMKLSLFEISLLSIVLTLSNLILEVPTGILADIYSRRLSVIVGGVFIGLAYVLMGAYPIFLIALLGAFIEAVGDTCVSGALQAWITDEVGADRVGSVFLRGRQVGIPAHWVGVLFSIALAARWNIQVPIVLGGAMWFVLTIFLIRFMPETNFQRPDASSPQERAPFWSQWGVTLKTFTDGMRLVGGSQILLLLFLAQLFGSIFFDSFYKFSRANILQGFTLPILALPILGVLKENAWFGMLEMLQGLFCLLGMEGVRRWANLNRAGMAARLLLGFTVLMLVGLGVFAWTGNFAMAILAWLVVSSLQEIGGPVSETWLNQHIPSNIRATVLSINSQVGMFGQMGGSTALGLFGDRFGVRRALGLSGAFLVPLLIIYRKQSSPTTGNTENEPLTQA